jgi:Insect cuticle protein
MISFSIISQKQKNTLQIAIVSTFLVAMALAEPPSSYLPPQARNFNSGSFGGSQPRTNYGAPAQGRAQQPRTNYGAPAASQPRTNYGPPARNFAQQPPATSYGVPSAQDSYNFDSQRANSYQQAPSSQYGAPAEASSSYSAPGYSGASAGGYTNGGYEEPAKYEFQYDVQDEVAALDFGHKEQREGSVATGKYYVLLPDGRKQVSANSNKK